MVFLLLQHTVNEKISQEGILNEQSNRLPSQLGEKKINRKVGIPLSSLLIHHKVSFLVSNIQLQGWAHSLFWTKHKTLEGEKVSHMRTSPDDNFLKIKRHEIQDSDRSVISPCCRRRWTSGSKGLDVEHLWQESPELYLNIIRKLNDQLHGYILIE